MGLPELGMHALQATHSSHTAAVQNSDRAVRGVAAYRPHPAPRPHSNSSAQPPEVTPDGASSRGRGPGSRRRIPTPRRRLEERRTGARADC